MIKQDSFEIKNVNNGELSFQLKEAHRKLTEASYCDSDEISHFKMLINIRKGSLRFVKPPVTLSPSQPKFNIEFTFDCEVRCSITIMYFCSEEVNKEGLIYTCRNTSLNSQTFHYEKGINQKFSQVCHMFDPSMLLSAEISTVIPVVIYCLAEEGGDQLQSHVTTAIVKNTDNYWKLIAQRQIYHMNGKNYYLHNINGSDYLFTYKSKVIIGSLSKCTNSQVKKPRASSQMNLAKDDNDTKKSFTNSQDRCKYCANCIFVAKNGVSADVNKDCLVKICLQKTLKVSLQRLKIADTILQNSSEIQSLGNTAGRPIEAMINRSFGETYDDGSDLNCKTSFCDDSRGKKNIKTHSYNTRKCKSVRRLIYLF